VNVLFPGQLCREEVSSWLAKSSIFVLPSLYEPFGLSALEAAYSACALVLSDIPSLREIWGDSALFFNPRNSQDLSDEINLLLTNDSLRKQFALKAIHKSRQYNLSNMVSQYFTLYNNLLKTSEIANLKN
jgi:glycosyltransferase involved in cell wall biosynthesis